jgi:phosphohistidine phosphatase
VAGGPAQRDAVMRDAVGMRRHLIIVRHAKSAWDDATLADHDRPLAARGVKALPPLRDHLSRAAHPPEFVLCSTSRRTVETLGGIRAALPREARVETERAVYGASADALLGRLQLVDDDIGGAMVIGHNPAVQDLALLLVGAGDPDLRGQLAEKLPTGTAVTLSFDEPWGDLGAGMARLDDLFMPRPPRS